MAKTIEEMMQQAQTDFSNFCRLFEGKPYDEIPNIVNNNNLDYGMFEFGDDESEDGFVDINYNSICATLFRRDGKIVVKRDFEFYDEAGQAHSYVPQY